MDGILYFLAGWVFDGLIAHSFRRNLLSSNNSSASIGSDNPTATLKLPIYTTLFSFWPTLRRTVRGHTSNGLAFRHSQAGLDDAVIRVIFVLSATISMVKLLRNLPSEEPSYRLEARLHRTAVPKCPLPPLPFSLHLAPRSSTVHATHPFLQRHALPRRHYSSPLSLFASPFSLTNNIVLPKRRSITMTL